MSNERERLLEVVEFAKKLCPSYSRLFENILEDADELEGMTKGSTYSRILRAIEAGYQLETEITLRANVTVEDLRRMVDAGVLILVPQGGKTEGARGARKMLYQKVRMNVTTVTTITAIKPVLTRA